MGLTSLRTPPLGRGRGGSHLPIDAANIRKTPLTSYIFYIKVVKLTQKRQTIPTSCHWHPYRQLPDTNYPADMKTPKSPEGPGGTTGQKGHFKADSATSLFVHFRVSPQACQSLCPCFLLFLSRQSASFSKQNRQFL